MNSKFKSVNVLKFKDLKRNCFFENGYGICWKILK